MKYEQRGTRQNIKTKPRKATTLHRKSYVTFDSCFSNLKKKTLEEQADSSVWGRVGGVVEGLSEKEKKRENSRT